MGLLVGLTVLSSLAFKHVGAVQIFDQGFETLARYDVYFQSADLEAVRRRVSLRRLLILSDAAAWRLLSQVLNEIGDRHASLRVGPSPHRPLLAGIIVRGNGYITGFADSEAEERTGLVRGDQLLSIDGIPYQKLRQHLDITEGQTRDYLVRSGGLERHLSLPVKVEPEDPVPYAYRLSPTTSYFMLPGDGFKAQDGAEEIEHDASFVKQNLAVLRSVVSPSLCGLVLDLRLNRGGPLPTQLKVASFIFGKGNYGYDSNPAQPLLKGRWGVDENGMAYVYRIGPHHDGIPFRYPERGMGNQSLSLPHPWVAVLINQSTASAGEAIAIASKSNAKTVLIGEQSFGDTTVLISKKFSSGDELVFSHAYMYDNLNQSYKSGLAPDVPARTDWSAFGTINDLPVRAAVNWFRQKGCKF